MSGVWSCARDRGENNGDVVFSSVADPGGLAGQFGSPLLHNLRPRAFDDRDQLALLLFGYLELVQGRFQVADGGVVFGVGDVHSLVGRLHVLAVVETWPAGGNRQKLNQVLLELLDVLFIGISLNRSAAMD